MKNVVKRVMVVLLLTVLVVTSFSQEFPRKPVTVICPMAAGGGTDAVLRALSREAEKFLGQSIIVSDNPGAGGAIGHSAMLQSPNDGYYVGMITFELNSLPPQGLVPFSYKDFDPLMMVNQDASALTVKADAPYNNIAEFIAYAKANPDKLTIGNAGPGSVWHVAAGLMADTAGIKVIHVPFDGGAPAATALVGGHVNAVTVSVAEVQGHVQAGALKILGIMDTKRNELFPNVPTFKEQGLDLVFGTWRGLAVPKGVKPEIREKLAKAFKSAWDTENFKTFAKNSSLGLVYMNSEDFGAFLEKNYNEVSAVMKKIGLSKK
jgi:tripartite-type tricarboxylate transporter receptor subunit TctC